MQRRLKNVEETGNIKIVAPPQLNFPSVSVKEPKELGQNVTLSLYQRITCLELKLVEVDIFLYHESLVAMILMVWQS